MLTNLQTFGGHYTHLGNSQGLFILRCSILKGWAGVQESPERHLLVSPEVTANDGTTTTQYRSIPFFYLVDLFQEDFWKYFVKKWGAEALRVYPVTEGRIVLRKNRQFRDWKLLDVPNMHPKWVIEARNIDSSGLSSRTVDDQKAFRIAHRRMKRAGKIAEAVIAKRMITTLSKHQEDSPEVILQKRLKIQKSILSMHKYRCRARAEEVDQFLRSSDTNTVEFKKTREHLIEKNRNDRVEALEWKGVASDENIAKEYQKIFDRYEKIKATIVPESDQKFRAREGDAYSERLAEEWWALLNEAHRLFKSNDISEATKICREIAEDVDAPNRAVAEAYFLLAGEYGPDRLWDAERAVEMFELIKRNSGRQFDEYINDQIAAAKWLLQKARKEVKRERLGTVTPTEVQSTDSKNTAQPVSHGLETKDSSKVQMPGQERLSMRRADSIKTEGVEKRSSTETEPTSLKFLQHEQVKALEATSETEEKEEVKVPAMAQTYSWKPKSRPGIDLSPKTRQEEAQMDLYDEAYATRQKGHLSQSEQTFLTLLQMKHLNTYTKAMCHVQLATMAHRKDQAEQARRAQLLFMQLELAQPESRRAAADRKAADRLMRVVARVEREKKRKPSSGLLQGLWSLLGRKRKRRDDEGLASDDGLQVLGGSPKGTMQDGGADNLVDLSEDYASPKKIRLS